MRILFDVLQVAAGLTVILSFVGGLVYSVSFFGYVVSRPIEFGPIKNREDIHKVVPRWVFKLGLISLFTFVDGLGMMLLLSIADRFLH
jgi:hypothetical protein